MILLLHEDLANLFRHREFSKRFTLPDAIAVIANGFVFIFEIIPEHFFRVFRCAYRLGSCHWHFAKIVDLPREDQGMIELLLGVDFELGGDVYVLGAAEHLGIDYVGDDGLDIRGKGQHDAGRDATITAGRYTHRVTISNRRLVAADAGGVSFRWKDYRIEGPGRWKTMTLPPHEFIRRFLIHVLPKGFHRIRHYGLLASANRAANIARARELLAVSATPKQPETPETSAADEPRMLPRPCPCCGGRMIIIETFARGCEPKHRPTPAPVIRIDTS